MVGTFNYCTQFFCQFFTIHGVKDGHYIPLLFCLLPDKRAETYKKMFNLILNECKLSVNIYEVVMDFEKAIHKAVEETWPNIRIIGCLSKMEPILLKHGTEKYKNVV
jgi:hypothetical protein